MSTQVVSCQDARSDGQNVVNFKTYHRNIHSQDGEDGILAEILHRLGIQKGYFTEFGAWDGKVYSNTYNLHINHGWAGCYIEGDPKKFEVLKENIPADSVAKVCAFVTPSGPNSLDSILKRCNAPREFDVLSIDIDSDDYAVWEGMENFVPKIVVVEYNPTIPNACFYVQPLGEAKGNSARALTELGRSKGYELVAVTGSNLIFVHADQFGKLEVGKMALTDLREEIGFIFHGYDGELIVTGHMKFNPWSHMPIIQPLPPFLRGFQPRPKIIGKIRKKYRKLVNLIVS